MEAVSSLKANQIAVSPVMPHVNDVFLPGLTTDADFLDAISTFPSNCSGFANFSCLEQLFNSSTEINANGTNSSSISGNSTAQQAETISDLVVIVVSSILLGLLILVTIIGNVFVIAAILFERNLQSVANYLIVSLAFADLLVACLVMPLGAVYEINNEWILGPELCDMWTLSDVFCCTASILHLVAIAVDRYWAVTNVDYIQTRNRNRICVMILVVWSVALVVSLAPQFGWRDPDYYERLETNKECIISQNVYYQIFATCSTFYVPLFVILVLYWKIFQTARRRIRKRREMRASNAVTEKIVEKERKTKSFLNKRKFLRINKRFGKKSAADALVSSLVMVEGQTSSTVFEENDEPEINDNQSEETTTTTTAFTITRTAMEQAARDAQDGEDSTTNGSAASRHQSPVDCVATPRPQASSRLAAAAAAAAVQPTAQQPLQKVERVPTRKDKKESLEVKRERKAAKTLAIITGAFVVCWLPFFVMALTNPLCDSCALLKNRYVASLFLWLGYFNSTLNPVIYTIFSPEFRLAFKKMLCGVSHLHGKGNAANFRSAKLR